jgi:hypothetical protein
MMRQDATNLDVFPPFDPSWSLNKDNEESATFSRMDELDNYKDSEGIYHFQ